jgi:ribonuclease HII
MNPKSMGRDYPFRPPRAIIAAVKNHVIVAPSGRGGILAPTGPEICGIDEAGRGPLAGPVYAAAVVLPEAFPVAILDDSKALSAARRESAFTAIVEEAVSWAIDWASPSEIDELNILGATFLAMSRAHEALLASLAEGGRVVPKETLVDGNRLPPLRGEARAIVGGDALIPAIMAASILAKVARDLQMERFDWLYPEYGYARHKGYPTKAHREVVLSRGPSPIQRSSFRVRA